MGNHTQCLTQHKRPSFGSYAKLFGGVGVALLMMGSIIAGSLYIYVPKAAAIASTGPDAVGEFGGANAYYELSDTSDVRDATNMKVPIYLKSRPSGAVTVRVTCRDGTASVKAEGTTICPGDNSFTISAGSFTYIAAIGYYKATITATLSGSYSGEYRAFKFSAGSGALIGYSAGGNTSHFAIANINRCDSGGDSSGCGDYFNYALPFAGECSVGTQSATVQLYDADNTGTGDKYNIQPTKFTYSITDKTTGTDVHLTTTGSMASNDTFNMGFTYIRGHKYILHLDGVYSNNVIQFHLPYDSINYNVGCTHGSVTFTCNADYSATVKYTYGDTSRADGESRAYTIVAPGTPGADRYSGDGFSSGWTAHGLSTSYTQHVDPSKTKGGYKAWLFVEDFNDTSANGGTYVDTNVVNGASGKNIQSDPVIIKCPRTPPTGTTTGDCPGDPVIDGNSQVTLSTPYVTPNGSSSWSGKTTKTQNDVQYQDIATSNSNFAIVDISAGGVSEAPPIISYGTDKKSVTVDYQKYVDTYPYDQNQAEAKYKTNYSETTWKADTFSNWQCDGGGTYNGDGTEATGGGAGKCGTYPSYQQALCPTAAFSHSDGTCYFTAPQYSTKATCIAHTGYNWLHNECLHVVSGYSCPSGEYASGDNPTGCYKNVNYPAPTEYWKYTSQGTPASLSKDNTSTSGSNYQMNACWPRNFMVTGVTAHAGLNDPEDPSQGTGTATVTVQFLLKHGGIGVRLPFKVNNLNYTGNISGGAGCSGYGSGTFDVTGDTSPADPGSGYPASVTCSLDRPVPTGTTVCAQYSVNPTGDEVDASGTIVTDNGQTIDSSNPDNCDTAINEAYLQVYGADVQAGNGFDTGSGCTTGSGDIEAFNKGGSDYRGAGTELGAAALADIKGFATAQHNGFNDGVKPPSGLAFANSGYPAGYNYGGHMAGYNVCMPNYYSHHEGTALATSDVSDLDGSYYVSGSLNGLSGTLKEGHRVVIYVNGDAYIDGSIVAFQSGAAAADIVDQLPAFMLVATGNIYINGSVSRLDGSYVAQGGTIYDCASRLNVPNTGYDDCSTPLTINGSFTADNIKFYRTGDEGSLRFSSGDSGPSSSNASEIFNYTPANWLTSPIGLGEQPRYDSITSLPPVL